jgi:hypothetical protein
LTHISYDNIWAFFDSENPPELAISSNNLFSYFFGEIRLSIRDYEKVQCVCRDGSQKELPLSESANHIELSILGVYPGIDGVVGTDGKSVGAVTIKAPGNSFNPIDITYFTEYDFSLELKSCQSMRTRGSGTAFLSFTPNPNEYTLHDQVVSLGRNKQSKSDAATNYVNSSFEVSVDTEAKTLVASGEVSEAIISGMSLFPDFRNWYFSNAYMAPFTIVSIAFSTLAQMLAVRKGYEK